MSQLPTAFSVIGMLQMVEATVASAVKLPIRLTLHLKCQIAQQDIGMLTGVPRRAAAGPQASAQAWCCESAMTMPHKAQSG